MQSALHPAGPEAAEVANLWWAMFVGSILIMILVVGMIAWGLLRARGDEKLAGKTMIYLFGIGLPLVTLTALIYFSVDLTTRSRSGDTVAATIEVVGKRWWWEVRYPGAAPDGSDIITANEIRIPAGQPVEIYLSTTDVIHSFWVPAIAGKLDMIPGRLNRMVIQADEPGEYRGQCAEFCGEQHALMAFMLVAQPPEEYAAWLEAQARPAPEPEDPFLARGRDAFLDAGCGTCHRVRGTTADGVLGPDLTHVGSRLTIGAGTLPNGIGPLAGWIADSQSIKPRNLMPNFNNFDGETLRAIAAWLESLE
ncbi:cytochrome c oxidase subunit II [Telmatospirillum sp. J64-1]|uniref:cytochrome c oxidase subunit II n=1 Tax=Telmatospirillum sp. J64-1 TaxID=2502183 RepID=UPI00115F2DB8|nr:cytochrome c oxidase subunit II [Telmatospirillum sp. J64-1]